MGEVTGKSTFELVCDSILQFGNWPECKELLPGTNLLSEIDSLDMLSVILDLERVFKIKIPFSMEEGESAKKILVSNLCETVDRARNLKDGLG